MVALGRPRMVSVWLPRCHCRHGATQPAVSLPLLTTKSWMPAVRPCPMSRMDMSQLFVKSDALS